MFCPYCLNDIEQFKKTDLVDGGIGYYCPNAECRASTDPLPIKYVEDYHLQPRVVFSLIGWRGHGKTCFLGGLFHQFERIGEHWRGFGYHPLDERDMNVIRVILEDFEKGDLPEPTQQVFPRPVAIDFKGVPTLGPNQVLMYDTSGEAFEDVSKLKSSAKYVTASQVVIWLVSLNDLKSPKELTKFLTIYLDGMRTLQKDPKKQKLIVVLSKGDKLLMHESLPRIAGRFLHERIDPSKDSWGPMEELSQGLEGWLRTHKLPDGSGYWNFVQVAKDNFADVRFTICTALGTSPEGQKLKSAPMPHGVLTSLWWLWRLTLPSITVKNPGSLATFFSLEDALAAAGRESTLTLSSGTHSLRKGRRLTGHVTIKGQGKQSTIIAVEADGTALSYQGDGGFEVSDLHFQGRPETPTTLLAVAGGEVKIERCDFQGARRMGDKGGVGLLLTGQTTGNVLECTASGNALCGILVQGQAQVSLAKNHCRENDSVGILFSGEAAGEAVDNDCHKNQKQGIQVKDRAQPTLRKNRCTHNASGIGYFGNAAGQAIDNTCADNQKNGVFVGDDAAPLLESNRCKSNGVSGIHLIRNADGAVRRNTCNENGSEGIFIKDLAHSVIEGNTCDSNKKHGIYSESEGKPTLSGNKCRGNADGDVVAPGQSSGLFGWMFGKK